MILTARNQQARTQDNRIYLFDNIKFLAIVLVVIGHAINFLTSSKGNMLEKSLYITIYSVHMPLFIFLSGLFFKPMDKSSEFPKQKVVSYVLIGIVLRIMMSLLRLILGRKMNYSVLDMYDSFAWFMWAMAVFITLVWLFREYNTKIMLLISVAVGCMAGYDKFLGDKLAFMRIIVFLPFFILGYLMKPEQLAKFLSKKWLKVISVIVVIGFTALFFINTDIYPYLRPIFTGRNSFDVLGGGYKFGCLIRLLCYAISALFGFSIMCLVPNKKLGIISSTGAKTLQIYFWHQVFLTLMLHFKVHSFIENITGGTVATAIYIILAVAVAFICALPIFSFPTKQLLLFGKSED